ncbi:exported hypothetical protein [Gammaproteobacteria bacterium]
MQNTVIVLLATIILSVSNARAADLETLLLLTGPISEAVQETVLLIRRGDNFISNDSLVIGCIAGASAGMMASTAPMIGLTVANTATPLNVAYITVASFMGCGMAVVGAIAGMATARALENVHEAGN